MPKSIEQLLDELIAREGGYVNNPADTGGATKFGITEREARANGYAGDMRDLTNDLALEIYRRKYWYAPNFHLVAHLSPIIAAELFDTGVNMGQGTASTFLQRALTALNRNGRDYPDLAPDGKIGQVTIAALESFLRVRSAGGEGVMMKALECLQGARYVELAERRQANEAFLFGWLANRVGDLSQ